MLKWTGASIGALVASGTAARYWLLPPRTSAQLASVDDLAWRFCESLDDGQRGRVCVDYEHPLRQYHNRGVRAGGAAIWGGTFRRAQRRMLNDLFHAGLSERGREVVPDQFFIYWPGVHLMNVLVCGDPRRPPYQIVLSGPHLMLRLGGESREGAAFGGPQVYGDQRGNARAGLPGNRYRYQLELSERLFESLSAGQREAALVAGAPIQTQIEVQSRAGSFAGIQLAETSRASQAAARELVDGILSNYAAADADYAQACLEHNGGVAALHASYYREGPATASGASQVFRLEGPAAVLYFRGHPHVHAFINIAMDGARPLSVGELLGDNPGVLERKRLAALFEAAMLAETGADFAYYPAEAAVGRLRPGSVRTGDLYTAESWQDRVHVLHLRGSKLAPALLAELRARGHSPAPARVHTLATASYAADDVGSAARRESGRMLREVAIDFVRAHGFPAA